MLTTSKKDAGGKISSQFEGDIPNYSDAHPNSTGAPNGAAFARWLRDSLWSPGLVVFTEPQHRLHRWIDQRPWVRGWVELRLTIDFGGLSLSQQVMVTQNDHFVAPTGSEFDGEAADFKIELLNFD